MKVPLAHPRNIDRFARCLSPIKSPDREEFEYELRLFVAYRMLAECPLVRWIQAAASAIQFNPSTFFVSLTDQVFENPELAYRPLLHLEQLNNILVAYRRGQLQLPAAFNNIDNLDNLLKVTKIQRVVAKRCGYQAPKEVDASSLASAERLLALNSSPARNRATVGETFQQPDLAEINSVVHVVRDRVKVHRTTLTSLRGQLAELVDDLRSETVEFLQQKAELATKHHLSSTISPSPNFVNDLEEASLAIREGKLRTIKSRALQNPRALIAKIRAEIALMNRCASQLSTSWKRDRPQPTSLETMRRLALKLQELIPHLDMLTRQWFSFELPNETDRYAFLARYPNVARVHPFRHTPAT